MLHSVLDLIIDNIYLRKVYIIYDLICSEVQLFATGEQTLDLIAYI